MTLRSIIILIALFTLACNESQNTQNQKVYTLAKGNTLQAFQYIANRVADYESEKALEESKDTHGYAPFAYHDRRVFPNLNDQEWLEQCASSIFKHLDYPLDSNKNRFVKIGKESNIFVVYHNPKAIYKFEELLKEFIIENKSYLEYVEFQKKLDDLQTKKANKAQ